MTINYILHQAGNPLYDGKFLGLNKKYQTYGLHSFIYDLALAAIAKGHAFSLFLDDLDSFPCLNDFRLAGIKILKHDQYVATTGDITILDQIQDKSITALNPQGQVIGIVHNYLKPQARLFYETCNIIYALTPWGAHVQREFCNMRAPFHVHKIRFASQGIYLPRFHSNYQACASDVLIFSRMDAHKGGLYKPVIDWFLTNGYHVSILGSGSTYLNLCQTFGPSRDFSILDHVNMTDIPEIIDQYGTIISNGRGVLESMALGKITIAIGVRYFGLIKDIRDATYGLDFNFTGWAPSLSAAKAAGLSNREYWNCYLTNDNSALSISSKLNADMKTTKKFSAEQSRTIAEKLFDVNHFLTQLTAT